MSGNSGCGYESASDRPDWKVYGPDLNGRFGGLQGTGGLEATVVDAGGATKGVLNDPFGNGVASVSGGTVSWFATRVGAYGPLPGSQTEVLTDITRVAEATAWRSRRMDATGFYYLGARYYEPTSGRFLSADPRGHGASMSLYDFANGDPVNYFDPTGRCGKNANSPESRLADILSGLDKDLRQNERDYLNDLIARTDERLREKLSQYNQINSLYDDANINNDYSLTQTALTTLYGAGAVAKELAGVTLKTSVSAIPGALGSTPMQGAIPLEYGGGIVGVGTGSIAEANAGLATVRYANYAVTGGGILLKETAKDQAKDFVKESVDFAHAALDPFGWLAKEEIAIADRQSQATQSSVKQLASQKEQLQQQLNQLGK